MFRCARIATRSPLRIGRGRTLPLAALCTAMLLTAAPTAPADTDPLGTVLCGESHADHASLWAPETKCDDVGDITTTPVPLPAPPASMSGTCSTGPLFRPIVATAGDGPGGEDPTASTGRRLGCLAGLARTRSEPVVGWLDASGADSLVCTLPT
jgi:hypothetical protein